MRYNLKTDNPLIEEYPDLSEHAEFAQCPNDKLVFVLSLLDEEDKETNLEKRVSKAAKIAKLKESDDLLNDKEVERAMCRYFVLLNKPTYELWLSKLIAFGECNHQLRENISGTKDPIKAMKTKLEVSELSEKLRTDIMRLERTLFKNPMIEKKMKDSVAGRAIFYAEKFAESDTVI